MDDRMLQKFSKNQKTAEQMEMESILAGVFEAIYIRNPHVMNSMSAKQLSSLIERHALMYLEQFGLEICKNIGMRIINLQHSAINSKSTFMCFHDLCKEEKYRNDRFNVNYGIMTREDWLKSKEAKVASDCLKTLLTSLGKERAN